MLRKDATIYAIKGYEDDPTLQYSSLLKGEGRFGWSGIQTADVRKLKTQIDEKGSASLTEDEQDCYNEFLLRIRPDDYVVFVNVPEWGKCTLARVTTPYFFRFDDWDFNHRFGVDPSSVQVFDRNAATVHPYLSARLKLRGRQWQIYAHDEFNQLLSSLATGTAEKIRDLSDNAAFLAKELQPLMEEVTRRIHHTHPNYDLEALVEAIFKTMPNVRRVNRQGGAGDHGADILVTYATGLPIPGLQIDETCVVQIKSYEGEHWDTKAVSDIRRAFDHYPEAKVGLIISTAEKGSEALDRELEKLKEEQGKSVYFLCGAEVAALFLRFYALQREESAMVQSIL
jgi:hypothetical protein